MPETELVRPTTDEDVERFFNSISLPEDRYRDDVYDRTIELYRALRQVGIGLPTAYEKAQSYLQTATLAEIGRDLAILTGTLKSVKEEIKIG